MSNYNLNSSYGSVMGANLTGKTTGKTFYVQASTYANAQIVDDVFPADSNGVLRVYNTLATALAACTASAGDVIYIAPGYTETISAATGSAVSVAGVTIEGLGVGSLRPTFTYDTGTDATTTISAANVTFRNCLFIANFAAVVAPFTLTTAKGFTLDNCGFRDTTSILNFVNIVDTNTTSNDADGLTITNCRRTGAGASSNTTIVKMDGTNDRLYIKNNYFAHAATTAAGLMIIATGKVVTNAEIDSNICNLVGASNLTTGILITTNGSTNSGYLVRNLIQGLDATTEILVTASSGFIFSQNYYSGTADTSGYLLPVADA